MGLLKLSPHRGPQRALALVLWLAACGAGQHGSNAASGNGSGDDDQQRTQPGFVAPEKYDEIRSVFVMRRPQASRCFGDAVAEGKINADKKGRVTVTLDVTAQGQPKNVTVSETTLAEAEVESCLVKLIGSWTLPAPGVEVKFSFAYNFEGDW